MATKATPAAQLRHTVVAILSDADEAARALRALYEAGFSAERVSLLAKDQASCRRLATEETCEVDSPAMIGEVVTQVEPHGREEAAGMAIGGTIGFVVGLTAIAIPGFGAFLLAAGPLAIVLNALTTSAAGLGLGALIGAILDDGATGDLQDLYTRRLEEGAWLLMLRCDEDEMYQASDLLQEKLGAHVDAF